MLPAAAASTTTTTKKKLPITYLVREGNMFYTDPLQTIIYRLVFINCFFLQEIAFELSPTRLSRVKIEHIHEAIENCRRRVKIFLMHKT